MVELNGTLLWQILNFFILVAILAKFAYKPLLKVMHDREQMIADNIASAERQRVEAEKMKDDYKQQMLHAREEAKGIIDKAMKQAEDSAQAHLNEVRQQIAREKELAQKEIDSEKERALADMRSEVITLSMAAAKKVLGKEIDANVDESILNDAIEQLHGKGAKLNG